MRCTFSTQNEHTRRRGLRPPGPPRSLRSPRSRSPYEGRRSPYERRGRSPPSPPCDSELIYTLLERDLVWVESALVVGGLHRLSRGAAAHPAVAVSAGVEHLEVRRTHVEADAVRALAVGVLTRREAPL